MLGSGERLQLVVKQAAVVREMIQDAVRVFVHKSDGAQLIADAEYLRAPKCVLLKCSSSPPKVASKLIRSAGFFCVLK